MKKFGIADLVEHWNSVELLILEIDQGLSKCLVLHVVVLDVVEAILRHGSKFMDSAGYFHRIFNDSEGGAGMGVRTIRGYLSSVFRDYPWYRFTKIFRNPAVVFDTCFSRLLLSCHESHPLSSDLPSNFHFRKTCYPNPGIVREACDSW